MNVFYGAAIVLFSIGLYCIVMKRSLLKIVIGLSIMEHAINLFIVATGYVEGGTAPILVLGASSAPSFVDPLVQALVLTSIVIAFSTTALLISTSIRLYERYRTFDITEMRRLRG